MNGLFVRVRRLLPLPWAILLACGGGGGGGEPAGTTVPPDLGASVHEGPFSLYIPIGSHVRVPGEGAVPFQVIVELDRPDAAVDLAEGETIVGSIVTVRHDRDSIIDFVQTPALLGLAFDPAALPEGVVAHELNVVLKARYEWPALSAEGSVVDSPVTQRLIGELSSDGDALWVPLFALPERMDLAVVYSPNLDFVTEEPNPAAVTREPPWDGVGFFTVFDPMDVKLMAAAVHFEVDASPAGVRRTVRSRISANAERSARYYADLGLRQPRLELREVRAPGVPAGERFLIHVVDVDDDRSNFRRTDGSPFGQIGIDVDDLRRDGLGGVVDVVHHELFHAVFSGYDIPSVTAWSESEQENTYIARGINEGLATTLGVTFAEASDVPRVYEGGAHLTFDLDMPFGGVREPYANQDVFVFLVRTYLNDDFGFLAGGDGLLDQMRLHAPTAADATIDDYLRGYGRALDTVIRTATDNRYTLHEAYDAFVRNRFFEHSPESALRPEDTHPPGTPVLERFRSASGQDALIDPSYVRVPIRRDGQLVVAGLGTNDNQIEYPQLLTMPPMSAALVVVEAGASDGGGLWSGNLAIDFDIRHDYLVEDGVRITVYPEGGEGISLGQPHFVDTRFGSEHERLYLLIVNTSLESDPQIEVTIDAGAEITAGDIDGHLSWSDGAPVEGATVRLRVRRESDSAIISTWAITQSRSDGTFDFGGIPAGTYQVRASLADLPPAEEPVEVRAGETTDVTLTFEAIGGIEGRVEDSRAGGPLADAQVELDQTDGMYSADVRTDPEGRFSFEHVPIGTYQITVSSRCSVDTSVDVSVELDAVSEVTIYHAHPPPPSATFPCPTSFPLDPPWPLTSSHGGPGTTGRLECLVYWYCHYHPPDCDPADCVGWRLGSVVFNADPDVDDFLCEGWAPSGFAFGSRAEGVQAWADLSHLDTEVDRAFLERLLELVGGQAAPCP